MSDCHIKCRFASTRAGEKKAGRGVDKTNESRSHVPLGLNQFRVDDDDDEVRHRRRHCWQRKRKSKNGILCRKYQNRTMCGGWDLNACQVRIQQLCALHCYMVVSHGNGGQMACEKKGTFEILIELGSPEAFAYFSNRCEQTKRLTAMNYGGMEKVSVIACFECG